MELPLGKTDVFLDDLVLQTILENIDDVKTIANAAAVCLAFAQAAHDVASDSLLMLLKARAMCPNATQAVRTLTCRARARSSRSASACSPCTSTRLGAAR